MSDLNPYQPPSHSANDDSQLDLADAVDLSDLPPVSFSGSPSRRQLTQVLAGMSPPVGFLIPMALTFFALLSVMSLFFMGSYQVAAVILGICLFFGILFLCSSLPYRTLLFQDHSPHWDQACWGELTSDGLEYHRAGESSFYRWTWFSRVLICKDVVALLPSVAGEPCILLGHQMLSGGQGVAELNQFAHAISKTHFGTENKQAVDGGNREILRAADRKRITPQDARYRFEGQIGEVDVEQIPRSERPTELTSRAIAIRTGLLISGALTAGGLLFGFTAGKFLFAALVAGMAYQLQRPAGRSSAPDRLHYYLIGHISDDGLHTDFFVLRNTTRWSHLRILKQSKRYYVLARPDSKNSLILRDDMFPAGDWENVMKLITEKINSQPN